MRAHIYRRGAASMRAKPDSAFLVIEVSHSSLRTDTTTKARIYAEAGIPEYWVINLTKWRVEVHTEPAHGAYIKTAVIERDGIVRARSVPLPPLHLSELFAD